MYNLSLTHAKLHNFYKQADKKVLSLKLSRQPQIKWLKHTSNLHVACCISWRNWKNTKKAYTKLFYVHYVILSDLHLAL